jgi:hypothetical protein
MLGDGGGSEQLSVRSNQKLRHCGGSASGVIRPPDPASDTSGCASPTLGERPAVVGSGVAVTGRCQATRTPRRCRVVWVAPWPLEAGRGLGHNQADAEGAHPGGCGHFWHPSRMRASFGAARAYPGYRFSALNPGRSQEKPLQKPVDWRSPAP